MFVHFCATNAGLFKCLLRTWTRFTCYIWSDLHFLQSWCNLKFGIPYLHRPLWRPWEKTGNFVFITLYCFPVYRTSHVWMCELDQKEGWASENWCFQLWCWRRLLRVPWTAGRSNQSILREINLEYSLKGLMLKLKLQYSGYPLRRADTLVKILNLGTIEGKRRRGWQKMKWLA